MRTFLIFSLILILTILFAPSVFATLIGGLFAITISGLVGLLIVGGVALLVGLIFGSTMLAIIAGSVTLLIVGFSVFWPLLLLFVVIWLCSRNRTTAA